MYSSEELQKLTDAQLGIINQYQAYLTKQHWIPVADRLPETARDVLVAFRLPKEKTYLITITQRASWSEKRKHDAFYQRGVTHWMEMPEPPKEET